MVVAEAQQHPRGDWHCHLFSFSQRFMALLHSKRVKMLYWKLRGLNSLTLTLSPVLGYRKWICVHSFIHSLPTYQWNSICVYKAFFPVHPKLYILSLFTYTHVIPYPSYYVLTPMRFVWGTDENVSIIFKTTFWRGKKIQNLWHSRTHLLQFFMEKENIWGWVNDE